MTKNHTCSLVLVVSDNEVTTLTIAEESYRLRAQRVRFLSKLSKQLYGCESNIFWYRKLRFLARKFMVKPSANLKSQ